MNTLILLKKVTPVCLIVFALGCLALLQSAQAIQEPDLLEGGGPGWNTALGQLALPNANGTLNTALGAGTLNSNTMGGSNTAVGVNALRLNMGGSGNTAVGQKALYHNTSGGQTAVGNNALTSFTAGGGFCFSNTAVGENALTASVTGCANTAIGSAALDNSNSGVNNTAVGALAGSNVHTASGVTCIGAFVGGDDVGNTTWIRNVYNTQTISGTTQAVRVSNTGQLGTIASSERFKKDISTMRKASEAVLSLRPVTFHYKSDANGAPQFGLIAEEVAKVNPDLVLPDEEGKPYTVRYDAIDIMLLNEFLKEHKKVEQLGGTVASLAATVKEQAAQIQKVSAQLEVNRPAPQVVTSRP